MYVGRIVCAGRTLGGSLALAYRVSSRSFPNRNAVQLGRSVQIVPRSGSPDALSDSPYIAYECLVWNERFAVASNGAHTRPIFERLQAGNAPRDAILSVLAGLDREFDGYDTPRICSLFDTATNALWFGSVTATALAVVPIEVERGEMAYVTTYGFPLPLTSQVDSNFGAASAEDICGHITRSSVFADFEKPICSAAVVTTDSDTRVATLNIEV